MGMPSVRVILIIVFLVDAASGCVLFTVFRWIGDMNPPAESVQLGLIGALGSLVYLFTCRSVSWLGRYLPGLRMPVFGIMISLIALVLLILNNSIWAIYLLWPMLFGSWAFIFPVMTGSVRYGRSGKSLRFALFLFCITWMSGVIVGAFLGSWLYGLPGQGMYHIGTRNVYLVSMGIYLICLLVLWLSGRKPTVKQKTIEQEHKEELVDPELAGAFVRVGWIGNILLMTCLMMLFSVFNKLATDLHISPEAHGWMVITLRIAAMTTAGFMILSLFWHYHWWGFVVAQGLAAVGLCIVGITDDYWMFMLGFVLCGIMMGHNYFAGVYYSLNSVSSSDAVGQRGKAALNESYFSMGSIAGAGLGGLVGWFSVRLPYFLAAGAMVLVLIIQLNTIRKARASKHLRQRQ